MKVMSPSFIPQSIPTSVKLMPSRCSLSSQARGGTDLFSEKSSSALLEMRYQRAHIPPRLLSALIYSYFIWLFYLVLCGSGSAPKNKLNQVKFVIPDFFPLKFMKV